MAKSIPEIEAEIIEEFSLFDDWMDKYQYIIEMGQELGDLAESHKVEENIVRGCQSKVWLIAKSEGGKVVFEADSDAIITKGLISMLIKVLSGQSPSDILQSELTFIDTVGIRQHLSLNRSNGLSAMIKKMKAFALGFKSMEELNQTS